MSTMNISLPEGVKAFVDAQVAERGFATSSGFIRELIRREWENHKLRALIAEALVPAWGRLAAGCPHTP